MFYSPQVRRCAGLISSIGRRMLPLTFCHSPRPRATDWRGILILHGLLHLAGYDHEKDNGVMERKEQRLRTSLGLSSSLIERNQNFKPGKRMSKKPQRRQRPSP